MGGVALGIGAFVALVGFSSSFEREWLNLYTTAGTDIVVLQKTFIKPSVDESYGEKLRSLPGIATAVPMILNMMDVTPEITSVVYGWPDNSFELDQLTILQGRRFRGGEPEIMLGEIMAENLDRKVGDHIEIQGASFLVVGVFRGGSAFETGGVLMPLGQLQKLSDLGNKVTAFHVRLRPAAAGESDADRIRKACARIEAALPGLKAVSASDQASNNQLVVLARASAWGISFIALFIGSLGMANTMAMSVSERTRDIGIMRALGWRRKRILRLILMESAMLAAAGGAVGLLGGWGAIRILATLPATASLSSGAFSLRHGIEALLIAVAIGLAAGFLPAWRGARLSPVVALRHE